MKTSNIRMGEDIIRHSNIATLAPQAMSAVGDILALNRWTWQGAAAFRRQIVDKSLEHYHAAQDSLQQAQWLQVLYRLAGVYSPLIPNDATLEEQCDRLFDSLQLSHPEALDDRLICYRLHRNLQYQAPCSPQLAAGLMQRCRQWLGEAPSLWLSLPFEERLQRLWILGAMNVRAHLLSEDDSALQLGDNMAECLEYCHQQLLALPHPDAEVLTAYYHTLILLFPDCKELAYIDLYDSFFECVAACYRTAVPATTQWWQLEAMLEHHSRDRQLPFNRGILPHLALLNSDSLLCFSLDCNSWESGEWDTASPQLQQDMREYARECAELLLPLWSKIEDNAIDLSKYDLSSSDVLRPLTQALHLLAL